MKYGVKEVMDVTLYKWTTVGEDSFWKPAMHFDTLKFSNFEMTAENVVARGGQSDPKLLSWDFARDTAINVQDALISTTTLGLLSGKPVVKGSEQTEVLFAYEEHVAVSDTGIKVTVTQTPLAVAPHVAVIYKQADDGTVTEATGTLASKTFTFASGVAAGDKILVHYFFNAPAAADIITFTDKDFPGFFKFVGDTVIRNYYTSLDEAFQVVIPRVKFLPGFTMNFQSAGDPSVFDLGFEVFKDPKESAMVKMIKY